MRYYSLLICVAVAVLLSPSIVSADVSFTTDLFDTEQCPVPCPDKSCCVETESCCDGECCVGPNMNMPQESCCPDKKHGGVCCEVENTFCCPPIDGAQLPSRCCPYYTVCCIAGKDGCCDPTAPNLPQANQLPAKKTAIDTSAVSSNEEDKPKSSLASGIAQGLFVIPGWVSGGSPLVLVSTTLSDGSRKETPLKHYDTFGEITPPFVYDGINDRFYLLRTNYTVATPYPIKLYTVDVNKGQLSFIMVQGAQGEVTGYAWHRLTQRILFATYAYSGTLRTGYNFYWLNLQTGIATLTSTYTDKNHGDSFAGWFHAMSADAANVYRFGSQDVYRGVNPGLGVTDVSSANASTTWITSVPSADGYGQYNTLSYISGGGKTGQPPRFVSLAMDNDEGELAFIDWTVYGAKPNSVLPLGNAYPVPDFGFLVPVVRPDGGAVATFAVKDNILSSNYDRWIIVVASLGKSPSASTTDVFPWLLAETDSLSGFGIADSQWPA